MKHSAKSIAAGAAFLAAVALLSSTTRAVSGLQYFGYWRESDFDNYICQIQDHANFSMNDESLAKTNYAASYGVANWGLTAPNGGSPAQLGATLLLDDADSAAWGWCATHPCPNGISDGWTGVKGEIEARFNQVQQEHPGQTVHGYINLADGNGDGLLDFQWIPNFSLPNGVDWVGLECYMGASGCASNLDALKNKLQLPPNTNVRFWILTPANSGYGSESWLVTTAWDTYNWAKNDPLIIGMIGFVFAKTILCPPDCNSLAVKEMPALLDAYRQIGDLITGKSGIPPIDGSPWPNIQCGGAPPPPPPPPSHGTPTSLRKRLDFDGDGKSDLAYYFPNTTYWWIWRSSDGQVDARAWGSQGAVPMPGDYDGDGKTDLAYYFPNTTYWWIWRSSDGQVDARAWGSQGAVPAPGDYDGDGKTDLAYYFPNSTYWWIWRSSDGQVDSRAWGSQGAIPQPGDYDGDGKTDLAYYFPNSTYWWIWRSSDGQVDSRAWGSQGAIPASGDYDGDGKTDLAYYFPNSTYWWIWRSSDGQVDARAWGSQGAIPMPGDYDGDGKTDLAYYFPNSTYWWIWRSSDGQVDARAWGSQGAIPVGSILP